MFWQHLLVAAGRTAIAFVMVLWATRILNKQFVGGKTYFDFTVGVTIGSLVAHVPNDYKEPFWIVAVPVLVVTGMGLLVGWIALKFEKVRHLMQGEPTVVIQNGRILEDNMRRLRYNQDQLKSQLRSAGQFDLENVEFAVLEPGGQLSVQPRSQHRPVTPSDLQIPTQYEGLPVELIVDGKVVWKNLRENHLNAAWLEEQLRAHDVDAPDQVYYAVLNTRGKVFIDLYQDELHRPVDIEGRNPSTPPSPTVP